MLVDRAMLSLTACVASDASRLQLQGVHFERPAADKPGRAVATDGHILAIVEEPKGLTEAEFPSGPFPDLDASRAELAVTIPSDTCKAIAKALPKKGPLPTRFALLAEAETVKNGHSVLAVNDLSSPQVFRPKKDDRRFPDVDRITPPAPSKEAPARLIVRLSAELLANLAEVARQTYMANGASSSAATALQFEFVAPADKCKPAADGIADVEWTHAVRVTGPDRFLGLIMPIRR